MRKFLILILLLLTIIIAISSKANETAEMIYKFDDSKCTSKIILIPLDSRPACGDFVVDAGRIAGTNIILPPSKILDYFTIPGEVDDLKAWLFSEAPKADAIIISIDQLINGGLIASREKILTDEDIERLINYLIELRDLIPNTPIYAFNILPRTQPQSSIDNYEQRRALITYSRLIGCAHSGLVVDDEALFETLTEITPENLKSYLERFKQSEKLSQHLITLTQNGILDKLVIGLDDGEEFSIQNKILDNLSKFKYDSFHTNKVYFIHGADEIALTLLAEFAQRENSKPLKVCTLYNEVETAQKILPFMAISVKAVVQEKLSQMRCEAVATPEEADFILYVSVNDNVKDKDRLISNKSKTAESIAKLIEQGHKVALVDLGIHFDKEETLLPVLINRAIPINSLIAYSGWNTTSNAIGIALSQAVIAINSNNTIDNLIFLNQHFLEDEIYLKDVIDTVNHALKKNGSYDTSYLDYGTEFEFATFVMRTAMNKKIADYKYSEAFRKTFRLPEGEKIRLKDFDVDMSYYWPRTFEIRLKINELIYQEVK